jgi:hypothetical protein
MLRPEHLPRQARDRRSEALSKDGRFRRSSGPLNDIIRALKAEEDLTKGPQQGEKTALFRPLYI